MSRRTPPPRPSRRAAPKVARARRSPASSSSRTRSGRTASPPVRARREVHFNTPGRRPDRAHRALVPKPRTKQRTRRRIVVEQPEERPPTDRFGLRQPAKRLRLVLLVFVLALGYVLFRVGGIQSSDGEEYREAGANLWQRSRSLPADRGTIFDRDGEELALSIPGYDVSVNPKLITNPEGTATMLHGALGLSEEEANELYRELLAQERGFVYVRREVDRECLLSRHSVWLSVTKYGNY